jgi:hypothetical protein
VGGRTCLEAGAAGVLEGRLDRNRGLPLILGSVADTLQFCQILHWVLKPVGMKKIHGKEPPAIQHITCHYCIFNSTVIFISRTSLLLVTKCKRFAQGPEVYFLNKFFRPEECCQNLNEEIFPREYGNLTSRRIRL